jgi:hypothetical protein
MKKGKERIKTCIHLLVFTTYFLRMRFAPSFFFLNEAIQEHTLPVHVMTVDCLLASLLATCSISNIMLVADIRKEILGF